MLLKYRAAVVVQSSMQAMSTLMWKQFKTYLSVTVWGKTGLDPGAENTLEEAAGGVQRFNDRK